MPQYWSSLVNPGAPWQTASGTALATAATVTISPQGAGGTGDDPQVVSWWQGQVVRVRARGVYTMGSTATNATFALMVSATGTALTGGTTLATTGALALPVSVTGFWWRLTADVQVRAFASQTSTPTLYTAGEVQLQTTAPAGTAGNTQVWPMPAASGPTAANIDVTVAHTIGLIATLSQVTGAPTITCTQITHEIISG
jgi:hypothetical protein